MNQSLRKITQAISDKLFKANNSTKELNNLPIGLANSIVAKCCPSCTYDQPLHHQKLVVFDTETTGFYSDKGDEIISISAVAIENGQLTSNVFDTLVNPGRSIPQQITELTGISEEMVVGKPDIFNALNDFLTFAENSVLIAHHASFDISFINDKLKNHCQTELSLPVLDTVVLSKMFFPSLPNHDLDSLITYFNLPGEGRHTSLGDSVITAHLYLKLATIMHKRQIVTLPDVNSTLRWRNLTCSIQSLQG